MNMTGILYVIRIRENRAEDMTWRGKGYRHQLKYMLGILLKEGRNEKAIATLSVRFNGTLHTY